MVFGDIVGGVADALFVCLEDGVVVVEDDDADGGGAWVVACSSVGVNVDYLVRCFWWCQVVIPPLEIVDC